MTIHFQRELTLLRKQILTVGTAVESAISNSITALLSRDLRLADHSASGPPNKPRLSKLKTTPSMG